RTWPGAGLAEPPVCQRTERLARPSPVTRTSETGGPREWHPLPAGRSARPDERRARGDMARHPQRSRRRADARQARAAGNDPSGRLAGDVPTDPRISEPATAGPIPRLMMLSHLY